MMLYFIAALVVLVYAALQTDMARKCKKNNPDIKEAGFLQYINTSMLVASSVAVLYLGWHLFMPDAQKAKVSSYF